MQLIAIILGLLPGFAWLFFYLQEDLHPEPKKLVALTFIAGAAFAFLALLAEVFLNQIIQNLGVAKFSILYLLILGFTEEALKFLAAKLVIGKSAALDEPVDAMIYVIVAALGFATVENLGALSLGAPGQLALISDIFATASLRFVGATLLHSLTSAVLGYYWAMSIREFGARKPLAFGLILAAALHATFNYLIVIMGNAVYALMFIAIIGFFVLNDFEKLKRKMI